MLVDDQGIECRRDRLLKDLGVRLLTKFETDGGDIYHNVTQPMRMLAELLIQVRSENPEIDSLLDCITQDNYRKVSVLNYLRLTQIFWLRIR